MQMNEFFEGKSILVTGGTGTIGSEIVNQLLKFNPKVIRILSNSENELWETKNRFIHHKLKLRFLLGDIRNFDRVKRAMQDINFVFNAAAIKHVPISEYNPMEALTVNVNGLDNIIDAAFLSGVEKMIHISTDKAVLPTTAMGATKMLGERLCISRNLAKGNKKMTISAVRFGNVLGSRGSIIPLIKKQMEQGNQVTLTGKEMNRFFMSISQAVKLVLSAMISSHGGEIFVLKMSTVHIKDLIEVIVEEYAPKIGKEVSKIEIVDIGPRIGEKFDEELISPIEYVSCYESEGMYIIYPSMDFGTDVHFEEYINGNRVKIDENFVYGTQNQTPLTKNEIRELITKLNLI